VLALGEVDDLVRADRSENLEVGGCTSCGFD